MMIGFAPSLDSQSAVADSLEDLSTQINQLERFYTFREPDLIKNFLKTNSDLADFLLRAYQAVEQYFGRAPEVNLDVTIEPEPPEKEALFANIVTTLSLEEAEARLARLQQEWFFMQLKQVAGRFNFDLEFA